jgi:hypothetical protein
MPWKDTCRMKERGKFIASSLDGERTSVELCEVFGIGRKQGAIGANGMRTVASRRVVSHCELCTRILHAVSVACVSIHDWRWIQTGYIADELGWPIVPA